MALTIPSTKLLPAGAGSSNFSVSGIGGTAGVNQYPTRGYAKPFGPEYGKAGTGKPRKFKPAPGDYRSERNVDVDAY